MHVIVEEFVAEIIGTAILMLFGISGAACGVLSKASINLSVALGYGFGVIIAAIFAGPISGAHINPAITVAFSLIGRISWQRVPIYLLGQYLGSFFGTLIAYFLYFESIQGFEMDNNHTQPSMITASIFITMPGNDHITLVPALWDQIISTGLLTYAILFIGDELKAANLLKTLTTGMLVMTFILAFSYNCGAILNPARDLMPRIILSSVGYGSSVFKHLNFNFWWAVGIVGPHLGAIIGSLSYYYLAKMRQSNQQKRQQQQFDLSNKGDNDDLFKYDQNNIHCKGIAINDSMREKTNICIIQQDDQQQSTNQ